MVATGSGKSTLLKIVAGVYKPTAGRIEVQGSLASLIEIGDGFHPELTGRENVLLNGLLMGHSKGEMLAREDQIVRFADLGEFINAPVEQYSSGMNIRLAFAVATDGSKKCSGTNDGSQPFLGRSRHTALG